MRWHNYWEDIKQDDSNESYRNASIGIRSIMIS